MPLAVAHQRETARQHAMIRIGGEQLSGGEHAIGAALEIVLLGEFAALCESDNNFAAARQPQLQQPR